MWLRRLGWPCPDACGKLTAAACLMPGDSCVPEEVASAALSLLLHNATPGHHRHIPSQCAVFCSPLFIPVRLARLFIFCFFDLYVISWSNPYVYFACTYDHTSFSCQFSASSYTYPRSLPSMSPIQNNLPFYINIMTVFELSVLKHVRIPASF